MTGIPLTIDTLRRFSPLDSLKRENIAALAKKMQVHQLDAGKVLFKEGDAERRTFYLLSGSLQLTSHEGTLKTIKGGSEEARNPISPILPRRWTAKAADRVEYVVIDTDLLDVMLTWDQTGSYEVRDLNSTQTAPAPDDWMTTLLQTRPFTASRRPTSRRCSCACRRSTLHLEELLEGDQASLVQLHRVHRRPLSLT